MRPIEAKAERVEKVIYNAGRWLDEDPDWIFHRLSVREYAHGSGWSTWRHRAVRTKALERVWREKWGSDCF